MNYDHNDRAKYQKWRGAKTEAPREHGCVFNDGFQAGGCSPNRDWKCGHNHLTVDEAAACPVPQHYVDGANAKRDGYWVGVLKRDLHALWVAVGKSPKPKESQYLRAQRSAQLARKRESL